MKAFILLNDQLRFAGTSDNTQVHVISAAAFEAWCQDLKGVPEITTTCGYVFRPMWVGRIATEDGPPCPQCKHHATEITTPLAISR